LQQALTRNVRSRRHDVKGKSTSRRTGKRESTDEWHGGRTIRSSDEAPVMDVDRRDCIIWFLFIHENCPPRRIGGTKMSETKPFTIEKQSVMNAYLRVRANKGRGGVDEMSLEEFNKDYKKHLYKIWN